MADRDLTVVAGALTFRHSKSTATRAQEGIAKRWRRGEAISCDTSGKSDVIPLLDGWIRRLEREAGGASEKRTQISR